MLEVLLESRSLSPTPKIRISRSVMELTNLLFQNDARLLVLLNPSQSSTFFPTTTFHPISKHIPT